MKFFGRTVGNTLFDYIKKEEIFDELKVETFYKKYEETNKIVYSM